MKKSCVTILLLALMLASPLMLAEEQSQTSLQTYSGFNRFVDNVRMFFSFGDGKVQIALRIREKEVSSALENIQNGNTEEVKNNLENAFNKLLFIQEKVSSNVADEVTDSVDKIVEKIEEAELTDELNRYVLEEKKTQLVAKLVVEVDGKEGQTLTREVVKNGSAGRNIVIVVVKGENGEIKTMEMEGELAKINNQIAEHTYAGGKGVIVVTGESNGDNGLTPEVKTYVSGDGTTKDEPLPTPDLNRINPDLYDPNARVPGDTIDETYDDANPTYAEGTTGSGTGTSNPGVNEVPSPAVDSNEGD
jgi:hypothetical protein